MDLESKEDRARLWKPGAMDQLTLFQARFRRFAYKRHVHEEYAIGVIEQGAQRFYHHGSMHVAPARAIISLNPDEVHDGQKATDFGYQYRMAYLKPALTEEILAAFGPKRSVPRYFRQPVTRDPALAARLHQALVQLETDEGIGLAGQTAFVRAVAELFYRHASPRGSPRHCPAHPGAVARAREYIRQRAAHPLSLEEIARAAGLSRFYLLRQFKAVMGLPPHAYQVQQRLKLAKSGMEKGHSLARAAADAGFADQSHFTRCFKAVYGLPPGRYRKSLYP